MGRTYELCLIVISKRIEKGAMTKEYADKLLLDFSTFKLADEITTEEYDELVALVKNAQTENTTE